MADNQLGAKEWYQKRRELHKKVLEGVIGDSKTKPSLENLHAALLEVLRSDDATAKALLGEPSLEDLHAALLEVLRSDDDGALLQGVADACHGDLALLEAGLSKALHTQHVLGLPCSEAAHYRLVKNLVWLRYEQSNEDAAGDHGGAGGGPATDRLAETWQWVDMLLHYSGALADKLQREEVDDEAVLLATISVLAIRAVKYSFKATYAALPWEELEFLLVSFAASRSKCQPEVEFLLTAERTRRHLCTFRTLLTRLQCLYRAADVAVFMGTFEEDPTIEREDYLRELQDEDQNGAKDPFTFCTVLRDWQSLQDAKKDMKDLHADCATLRDCRSLKDVKEALAVAVEALDNSAEWESCGRLALPMALLLVGERVKNAWQSPHLSTHYVNRIQLHLSDGVTTRLQRIRDDLLHAEGLQQGVFFQRLETVHQMNEGEKDELRKALHKAKVVVDALVAEAAGNFYKYGLDQYGYNLDHEEAMASIQRQVGVDWKSGDARRKWVELTVNELRILASTEGNTDACAEYESVIRDLESYISAHSDLTSFGSRLQNMSRVNGIFERMRLLGKIYEICSTFDQFSKIFNLVRYVLFRNEFTEEKNYIAPSVRANFQPPNDAHEQLTEQLKTLLAKSKQIVKGDFAFESALLALASLQTGQCNSAPCADLAGPVLFGGLLRNYLAHKDFFIEQCMAPNIELAALCSLLLDGEVDLKRSAEPRQRTAREARAEFDRLLSLVSAKCSLFRAVGNPLELQCAAEAEPHLDLACTDCRGNTLLHAAAQGGHRDTMQWLLDSEAVKPQHRDAWGRTALWEAANREVAELLIKNGGDVTSSDEKAAQLGYVLHNGRHEVAGMLLGMNSLRVHLERYGVTEGLLLPAALSGCKHTVQLVLDATTPPPSYSDLCEALRAAARVGHFRVVEVLLGKVGSPADAARAALPCSCDRTGDVEVLQYLLSVCPQGEAETWRDDDGWSLLHHAAYHGNEAAVRFLVGAAPRTVLLRDSDGGTPLHRAAFCGHVGVVSALLDAIPDTGPLQCDGEVSPLHWAAVTGQAAVIEKLVKGHNWSVHQVDGKGRTPLVWAACCGETAAVRLLLDRGADRHVCRCGHECEAGCEAGSTTLEAAVQSYNVGTVRAVLEQRKEEGGRVRESPQQLLELLQQGNVLGSALMVNSRSITKFLLEREKELLQQSQTAGHEPLVFRSYEVICEPLEDDGQRVFTLEPQAVVPLHREDGVTSHDTYYCLIGAIAWHSPREMVQLLLDDIWHHHKRTKSKDSLPKIHAAFELAVLGNRLTIAEAIHEWDRKPMSGRKDPIIFTSLDLLRFALWWCSPDMARLLLRCMWESTNKKQGSSEKDVLETVKEALFLAVEKSRVSNVQCMLEYELERQPPPKKQMIRPLIYQQQDGEMPLARAVRRATEMRDQALLALSVREGVGVSETQAMGMIEKPVEMVKVLLRFMWEPKFLEQLKALDLEDMVLECVEESLLQAVLQDYVGVVRCILEWERGLQWSGERGTPLLLRKTEGKTPLEHAADCSDDMKNLLEEFMNE